MDSGAINCDRSLCGKIIISSWDLLNFELPVEYPSGKIPDSYLNMHLKFNNMFSRYVGSE